VTLNPFSAEIIEISTFLVHISKTVADRTTVAATNPHRVDPAEFNGAIFRPLGVPQMGVFDPQISNFDYISELRQRNFTKLLAHVDYDARVA